MAEKINKSAVIRARYKELGGGAEAIKTIAAEVGCSREYVRIVARQRRLGGKSDADRRYEQQPYSRSSGNREFMKERYATDAEFRQKKKDVASRWWRERSQCPVWRAAYNQKRAAQIRAQKQRLAQSAESG